MSFWWVLLVGWALGVATFPLLMLVAARTLARSFDGKAHGRRKSAAWLRQRLARNAHVSPEARRWLGEEDDDDEKRRERG